MTSLPLMPSHACSSSIASCNASEVRGQSAVTSATPNKNESKKLGDAARQFEAVFLRQILSSVERAASVQGGKAAGSNLYGSMLVDAVADSISRSGGMGLASMLVKSLGPQLDQVDKAHGSPEGASGADSAVGKSTGRTYNETPTTKEQAAALGPVPGGPR